ncbi:MAG: GvpL/GvpF family gas vesicle protein [Coprothermobacterota bacterium]|nr:GvpL/GvpF family gas vesicle protein [Coprothermobacterota bacterium]
MSEGCYVYCVLHRGKKEEWGPIGLDGAPVFQIAQEGIACLVHRRELAPYQGEDEQIKNWVVAHNQVVETAWKETGAVLPMTFNCIIQPLPGHSADEVVQAWLRKEGDHFQAKLAYLEGKVELGVQVIWTRKALAANLLRQDEELKEMTESMNGKPRGMTYFLQQKLEKALAAKLLEKAEKDCRHQQKILAGLAEEVASNKLKKMEGERQMILNLSLLARRDQVDPIGETLDTFQEEGVEVRFTGPWPPYSFTTPADAPKQTPYEAAGGN